MKSLFRWVANFFRMYIRPINHDYCIQIGCPFVDFTEIKVHEMLGGGDDQVWAARCAN